MFSNGIRLTDEQEHAVVHLLKLGKQVQVMGGYAGTGKTTVVKVLKDKLPGFAVCSYTGKATNVLRQKGLKASTIHSLIYLTSRDSLVDDYGKRTNILVFRKKTLDELRKTNPGIRGFIVDEYSMVNKEIYDDIVSYKLPVFFIGDHGQLEPVGKNSGQIKLIPDVTLEKIHRNAGPISAFAEHVRLGNQPSDWSQSSDQVSIVSSNELDSINYMSFNQIVCGYNATRVGINRVIRQDLGYPDDTPVIGDRVMCLQNDKKLKIYNGMQGTVHSIDKLASIFYFNVDGNLLRIPFVKESFNKEKKLMLDKDEGIAFDYAYCVTCHKMQGDECDNLLVLQQDSDLWDSKRWNYTAASRARKSLIWTHLV